MTDGVRVMVYAVDPEDAPGSVEAAYHEVSRALKGTPGLTGNALLRAVDDPRAFAVLSEWDDLDAFRTWEVGTDHRGSTSALRPFQDSGTAGPFRIYEVAASY